MNSDWASLWISATIPVLILLMLMPSIPPHIATIGAAGFGAIVALLWFATKVINGILDDITVEPEIDPVDDLQEQYETGEIDLMELEDELEQLEEL